MARFTEILENPLPGTDWRVDQLDHHNRVGEDEMVWTVKLVKCADGTPVEFTTPDLFLSWVRAVEAANAHEKGIFKDD